MLPWYTPGYLHVNCSALASSAMALLRYMHDVATGGHGDLSLQPVVFQGHDHDITCHGIATTAHANSMSCLAIDITHHGNTLVAHGNVLATHGSTVAMS